MFSPDNPNPSTLSPKVDDFVSIKSPFHPNHAKLSPHATIFAPAGSAREQRSKTSNNKLSTRLKSPKPQPVRARKKKITKRRATAIQEKAYGSLRPQRSRRFRVSEDALSADTANLRLFTLSKTLPCSELTKIIAALRTAPRYRAAATADGGVSQDEVATFKVENIRLNQTEFRSLEGNGWLYDEVINMFLRAHVQNKVEGAQCFSSRFFNLLWYQYDVANGEADHGSYEGFGPRGTPPDTPEAREGIPASQVLDRHRFWTVQSLDSGLQGGLFSQDNLFVYPSISAIHTGSFFEWTSTRRLLRSMTQLVARPTTGTTNICGQCGGTCMT